MTLYLPVEENFWTEESGGYRAFGIGAYSSTPAGLKQVAFVQDTFLTLSPAEALASRCTQEQLNPVHLIDVVLDVLNQD